MCVEHVSNSVRRSTNLLQDLFTRIAPVRDVNLRYDRSGRSDGTAFVTYDHIADARTAVREFDGANAKSQPIRLTILPLGPKPRRDNPFDRVENPRSLFDRIEAPARNRRRSESPVEETRYDSRDSSQRRPRATPRDRRSDTTKPAPENIDRYVPGEGRRGGRRPGERRERPAREGGAPTRSGARPKKTAEELDAEMDDYFAGVKDQNGSSAAQSNGAGADGHEDDIDMIT